MESEFGKLLRIARKRSLDPNDHTRTLTQEKFGELLGDELQIIGGFSGTAVSDWERGESKIHADHRKVLVSIIKILHHQGGLKSSNEANKLLEAGNYRNLNNEEGRAIFRDYSTSISENKAEVQAPFQHFVLENIFFPSRSEFQSWLSTIEEGPRPVWPRTFMAVLRRLIDQLSTTKIFHILIWAWVWITGYVLIAPSVNWPFQDTESVSKATQLYIYASFILPLCIGALVNTDENTFWKNNKEISGFVLRLYTYQGAFIGFHLGYFVIFAINLFLFFLGGRPFIWFQFMLLGVPLILGYTSAQVVPYNILRAFERLHLKDGAIFFVFIIIGPLWGWYFLQFNTMLLSRTTGILLVLTSLTLMIGYQAWRYRQSRKV